ncbi:MAG TPA: DUF3829 domain-containing protein [Polyangiaceae bacterium]|jgi:hypothetical protein|nr:MAG: hypothetical protein BWY17_01078 [Deltaproteobacteria bacterium ADurb.Bin207]HNS99586.1 DUF3829 domain-containing protein [Polyangiaceae bacterium]HNZ22522.1 DUF3829 domain-containing protein [Polyangiaceae bacterium]HOD22738.1 DUF3829 domain-containing protein [Polyangiaceae bacterium]HOE48528.1 DUF3829 domain-containing protein [Polyangiaceae bacterium]
MSQRVAFMIGVMVLMVALGGCQKRLAAEQQELAPEMGADDPGLEDPGESHRDSKVDRTIKCFNGAMRINKAAQHYFGRLAGGLPRPGKVPSVVGVPPATTLQLCQEAKADLTPPMAEIDRIMPRYVELVASLIRRLEQMDKYYKEKGYRGDGFRQGKQMHESFKSEQEEFQKLHDQLASAIDAVADKRDDEAIHKESKTRRLRYYSLVFLRDAKLLSREITRDKPDVPTITTMRLRVADSHKDLSTRAMSHPDEVDKAFMFAMYMGRADTFVQTVRNVDPTKLVDQDLDDMLNKYNAMIDASNLVRWKP